VISRGFNDPAGLARYHLSDEEEKRVRKAFRKPEEQPRILIVTEKLEKALAFDSSEIEGVVENIDILFERFQALISRGRADYLPLVADRNDDKAAEAVLDHFRDEQRREGFYAYFRELEEVYEILSPGRAAAAIGRGLRPLGVDLLAASLL
jgi:hypothetical protein